MSDLLDFLRARLDDDAALIVRNSGDKGLGDDGSFPDYRTNGDDDTAAADDYLEQFKPLRMLREVEAKRRILDAYERMRQFTGYAGDEIRMEYNEAILPALALPYSDHPAYRPEWRP